MKKNGKMRFYYAAMSLVALVLFLCLTPRTAQAASYTDWSEWSTEKPTGTHAQTETRKVASVYHMKVYYTQEAKSPYYRNIRDYSIGGDYARYGARSTYGEFHYTRTMTAKEFASAKQYQNGAWIQQGTNGNTSAYHRGNGTAYQLGDMSWFVESIDYVTEYRYRDILVSITDPEPSGPIVTIPTPTPTPTPTPGSEAATGKTTEITGTKCTESGIQITWKAVSGVTGYYVYRDGKKIATITGSGTHTYLDKKAKKNGKTYKYTVCIYVKVGGSVTAGKKCKETVVVYLTANLSPKATGGDGTVKVTWTPNKKCMGYEIWYSTGKKFKNYKKAIVKGSGSKSKKLTGLEGDTVYYIKIRVYYIVNGAYSYSPFCPVFRVKTSTKTCLYKGVVSNAQDGSKLKNVRLYFRKGSSNKTGSVYKTCKTDAKGRYKVRLPKGTYTVEVRSKNYVTIYITIYVSIDSPSYASNPISISKPLSSDQYRIVLTWGAVPADLDAHLTGPSSAYGGRYHVFFRQKNGYYGGRTVANLDVDDTTSYGPETVTINVSVQKGGTYQYYVHDYTNRGKTSSTALGNSGARVMVYNGNKHIATYKVPKKAGTAWHVFTIQNGKLVKKNTMTYVQNEAAFQ